MDPNFDFQQLALVLAGVSFGLIGVMMAGGVLWPEWAERAKKLIVTVITGLVLIGVSSVILAALGG